MTQDYNVIAILSRLSYFSVVFKVSTYQYFIYVKNAPLFHFKLSFAVFTL